MSTANLHIRHATEADAPQMGAVMVATWLAAHKDQIPAAQWEQRRAEWTPAVSARGWAETLRDIESGGDGRTCIYVVADNASEPEQVAGIVMGQPADVALWPNAGQIPCLYVAPAFQGRGLGRRLLATAVAHLQDHGLDRLIIHCLDANKPAARFYEALGGRLVGTTIFVDEGFENVERIYGWEDVTPILEREA